MRRNALPLTVFALAVWLEWFVLIRLGTLDAILQSTVFAIASHAREVAGDIGFFAYVYAIGPLGASLAGIGVVALGCIAIPVILAEVTVNAIDLMNSKKQITRRNL